MMYLPGQPLADYPAAAAFLEYLVRTQPRAYLQRAARAQQTVAHLLAEIGNPQRGLPIIHIAGSKGKGSTALMCEAILQAAGLRSGVFTSPHLQHWTERMRIDGYPIDRTQLVAVLERLRPGVESLQRTNPQAAPGFFDVLTAAALLAFREAGVDYAVIETGLGGRLDATNVVIPTVTCITSIELEHTEYLGTSLTAIAEEKAGIVKPGVPLVSGLASGEAADVLHVRAHQLAAPLSVLGIDFTVHIVRNQPADLAFRLHSQELQQTVALPLSGIPMAYNAALAAVCIQRLGILSNNRLAQAVGAGLGAVQLPARCEIFSHRPWVIVDSAHTTASAQALAAVLERIDYARLQLLISLSSSKDLAAVCNPLLPICNRIIATRAEPDRCLPAEQLAAGLRGLAPDAEVIVIADPGAAIHAARNGLGPEDALCVAGSVYLAGIAREYLASVAGQHCPE